MRLSPLRFFLGFLIATDLHVVVSSFQQKIQSAIQQQQGKQPNKKIHKAPNKNGDLENNNQSLSPSSSSSSSLTMSSGADSSGKSRGFLKALFRGITLPFPMLRKLMDTSRLKSNKNEYKDAPIGFSLYEAVIAICCYLVLGIAAYSSHLIQDDPWSLIDALYFSVVTFTTVGYGDLCPTTLVGKAFTVLFGLTGISILGFAVATITSRIVEKESQILHAAQEAGRKQILGFLDPAHVHRDHPSVPKEISKEKSFNFVNLIFGLIKNAWPSLSVLLAGGIGMGYLEGWSIQDSIYYAFITAGTLGYGDFSPITSHGRLWAVIFIPLAVGTAGEVLGGVANWLVQRRQNRFYKIQLERELNIDRLLDMDADKNNKVSREEYVEFMLKEMQLVDHEVFQELHAQFNKLDADGGGYLDKNDLKLLVMRRQKAKEEKLNMKDSNQQTTQTDQK